MANINKSEQLGRQQLRKAGWIVNRGGWPDFWCEKDDKIIFVEIKRTLPEQSSKLREHQFRMWKLLESHGFDCLLWRPDGLFKIGLTLKDLISVTPESYGLNSKDMELSRVMSTIAKLRWKQERPKFSVWPKGKPSIS